MSAKFINTSRSQKNNTSYGVTCQTCENLKCLIKRRLPILNDSRLVQQKNNINCKKGQQFIIEGAPVNGLFFILEGKVKVFRTGINGREQIVRFANEGEIIGHRGFGTEEYYSIGAIALEQVKLCYFSKDVLQEALRENPTFTYDMMLFYANELNTSDSNVQTIAHMTVRERVVDTILYINRKFGT